MTRKIVLISNLVLALFGIQAAGVAYGQAAVEKSEYRIVGEMYQIIEKDMQKIDFDAGREGLSDANLAKINQFVNDANADSKVDRFIVATWSDKDYPTRGELPKQDRLLALRRAGRVKASLLAAGAAKVETFEMTKQPNWIQRAFSTDTAEVKNKGLNVTLNERVLKEIGQKLRDKGGPQSAVIVAKFKNEIYARK